MHYEFVMEFAQFPTWISWASTLSIAAVTDLENRILNTLLELENAVANMASAPVKPDLVALFGKLDQFAGELPPGSDPELKHFLQRKSYQKARLLLQGKGTENKKGVCGH